MGHARAILAVDDPVRAADLARDAVAGSWSVRETEKRAREAQAIGTDPDQEKATATVERDPAVGALEEALAGHLGARVAIRWKGDGAGAIRIAFHGARDLERIFAAVTGREAEDIVG